MFPFSSSVAWRKLLVTNDASLRVKVCIVLLCMQASKCHIAVNDSHWILVHEQLAQEAYDVEMTSSRRIDVNTTSFQRCVPAGDTHV